MSKYRMIECIVGQIIVFVGAGFCFCGNLNYGVGLALIGLMMYLTDERLCSNAVYDLLKRKIDERRNRQ